MADGIAKLSFHRSKPVLTAQTNKKSDIGHSISSRPQMRDTSKADRCKGYK